MSRRIDRGVSVYTERRRLHGCIIIRSMTYFIPLKIKKLNSHLLLFAILSIRVIIHQSVYNFIYYTRTFLQNIKILLIKKTKQIFYLRSIKRYINIYEFLFTIVLNQLFTNFPNVICNRPMPFDYNLFELQKTFFFLYIYIIFNFLKLFSPEANVTEIII